MGCHLMQLMNIGIIIWKRIRNILNLCKQYDEIDKQKND